MPSLDEIPWPALLLCATVRWGPNAVTRWYDAWRYVRCLDRRRHAR